MALTPDRLHILHSLTQLGAWQSRVEPSIGGDGNPLWLEYPVHQRQIDVVALPLTQLTGVQMYPYETEQPERRLLSDVGSPVSIIGFPFGRTGGGAFGIWSKGWIATEPEINFDNLPCFLIDSRTRQGQSGHQ